MADEKVDLTKAVTSLATPLYWVKLVMYILGAGMLFFIGYGVYKAYFKKPPDTTLQKADQITNYYQNPKVTGFGCIRFFPQEKK